MSSSVFISDVMPFLISCWVQLLDVFLNGGYIIAAVMLLPILRMLLKALRSIISR